MSMIEDGINEALSMNANKEAMCREFFKANDHASKKNGDLLPVRGDDVRGFCFVHHHARALTN